MFGKLIIINEKNKKIKINGIKSLIMKFGKNFILSKLVLIPKGLEEPDSCNKIKWKMINIVNTIGKIKWSLKNRFKVGWETEKFPQIQDVIDNPKYGIAEIILVITVAPQNDICPQGKT